jgi:simple sugar transport system permease protein
MSSTAPKHRRPLPPVVWPLAGLVLLVIVNAVFNVSFLKVTVHDGHLFGVPIDILTQGSRTMLVALGMTLVIATGGVDLSVGSVAAITGAVCAIMLNAGMSLALALPAAIAAGAATGMMNGLFTAKLGIQPIVATLILMIAGRGVAQLVTGGQVLIIKHTGFEFLANGFLLGLPFAPLLVAALFVLSNVFLRRTAAGLFIEAVGDNEVASRFAGLAATRVKVLAYVFCGACAGLAGALCASNIRSADPYRAGENMELDAIFAVVVGGTALTGGRFSLLGSWVGALLLQTLTITMYNLGVPPAVAPVPKAILIITVALLQSEKLRTWFAKLGQGRAAA